MNSDMDDLLRAASYVATIAPSLEVAVRSLNDSVRDGGSVSGTQSAQPSAAATVAEKGVASLLVREGFEGNRDTSAIAAEISRLTEATRANAVSEHTGSQGNGCLDNLIGEQYR